MINDNNNHWSCTLYNRVEWFNTFCNFRKATHFCQSALFLKVKFKRISNFGHLTESQVHHSFPGLEIRSAHIRSFAHFAQIKWATVSELLRSLGGNERPWANRSGLLRQKSDHERFAQVAQRKRAIRSSGCSPKMSDVSKSLRSLTKNEQPWAICSGRSPKMSELLFFWANRLFAHFFANKQRFAQKTDERIPSPACFILSSHFLSLSPYFFHI